MLLVSGLAKSQPEAAEMLGRVLTNGRAAEFFNRMVHGLGGPPDFVEHPERYLPKAPVVLEVHATDTGFVTRMNTRDLGLAVVALGGGRSRVEDIVDPAVGIVFHVALGDRVTLGQTLAVIHARHESQAQAAARTLTDNIVLGPQPLATESPVLETIS
jgi:thymidine phosphorylase